MHGSKHFDVFDGHKFPGKLMKLYENAEVSGLLENTFQQEKKLWQTITINGTNNNPFYIHKNHNHPQTVVKAFIVDFGHDWRLVLVFLLLALGK